MEASGLMIDQPHQRESYESCIVWHGLKIVYPVISRNLSRTVLNVVCKMPI